MYFPKYLMVVEVNYSHDSLEYSNKNVIFSIISVPLENCSSLVSTSGSFECVWAFGSGRYNRVRLH